MTAPMPATERGLLVAAVRQLIADGWTAVANDDNVPALRHKDLLLQITLWGEWLTVEHLDPEGLLLDDLVIGTDAGSIPMAISHLAVRGLLPRSFAFWSPPLPVRPMHVPADCPLCSTPIASVAS